MCPQVFRRDEPPLRTGERQVRRGGQLREVDGSGEMTAYGYLRGSGAPTRCTFEGDGGVGKIYMKVQAAVTAFVGVMTLGIALFPVEVTAQTRCSTDSFGNTTCRDGSGNAFRGSRDSFGNETWRDNFGNTVRGFTDSFGNTTYRDNKGNTMRGSRDSFGNETWTDNSGNTIRGTTDSFGNTTYRDGKGNTTRCSKDTFGNTTCR